MKQKKYAIRPVNKIFISGLLLVLVLFAGIAASSSYYAQRDSLMQQCEGVLEKLFGMYYEKIYDFSDLYLPIFRSDEGEEILRSYFDRREYQRPNARERAELVKLIKQMIQQDTDVVFVALYNPNAANNYYLMANETTLQPIWNDIPIGNDESKERMQLLGRYAVTNSSGNKMDTFLIRGGTIPGNNSGAILVGYNATIFEQILGNEKSAEVPATFVLWNEEAVIYDSKSILYGKKVVTDWMNKPSSYNRAPDGTYWYTRVFRNEGRAFSGAYLLPWIEVVRSGNRAIGLILVTLLGFTCFSLALYIYSTRSIFHKVQLIQEGLMAIGENQLDYRLQITNKNDEFDQIASNINTMAGRLSDSIENEYQMRMQQKWSELSQIQARFNPHFLYNTLEVIRGKLFQNGDVENADYIEKLSRIFRSLTDAEPVITIREEISFCSLYLALLQLRYHDAVDITYEVEAELQQCGILAHLIQPAIENYFIHAMSDSTDYHELKISCEKTQEDRICFIIADNGSGILPDKLKELNQRLRNPEMDDKGYGLMSIAKRIRLFYGENYGIVLEDNKPCGTRVLITIPKMDKEEHLRKLGVSKL